jgi:hypothetical protein
VADRALVLAPLPKGCVSALVRAAVTGQTLSFWRFTRPPICSFMVRLRAEKHGGGNKSTKQVKAIMIVCSPASIDSSGGQNRRTALAALASRRRESFRKKGEGGSEVATFLLANGCQVGTSSGYTCQRVSVCEKREYGY